MPKGVENAASLCGAMVCPLVFATERLSVSRRKDSSDMASGGVVSGIPPIAAV